MKDLAAAFPLGDRDWVSSPAAPRDDREWFRYHQFGYYPTVSYYPAYLKGVKEQAAPDPVVEVHHQPKDWDQEWGNQWNNEWRAT